MIKTMKKCYSCLLAIFITALCFSIFSSCKSGGGDSAKSDTIAPSAPTGVQVAVIDSHNMRIDWHSSTDNTGIAGYKVYREGSFLKSVSYPYLTVNDTGLTHGTQYCYSVSAYDAAGNESAQSSSACATTKLFSVSIVDGTPGTGLGCSIITDMNSKAYISYYDFTNYSLKLATNSLGTWGTTTVSTVGGNGYGSSIALNSNGNVNISYYDNNDGNVKYATNASGIWTITPIGPGGYYPAIAIDSSDKVYIGYENYSFTSGGPNLITNATGTWVSTLVEPNSCCSDFMDMALDANGNVHIAYTRGSDGSFRYATNSSGSFTTTQIDSGDRGASIAIDKQNKIHIAYYDWSGQYVKYATNSSGAWITTTITSVGTSGYSLSLVLDSNNKAHIISTGQPRGLFYSTDASGSWVTTTIDSTSYFVGLGSALAIDVNNNLHVCYSAAGSLSYATTQ